MEKRSTNLPPSPPGVIPALIRGFNAVANRALVILIPIVFDLFLWLGPRLSVYKLVGPALDEVARMPGQNQGILENMAVFHEFFEGFNAFAALRTFPLGIFSLMSSSVAVNSPLGERAVVEAGGLPSFLLWVILMTVAGWLLGGFYFYSVAKVTAVPGQEPDSMARKLVQGMALSGFWSGLWLFASLPLLVLLGVLLLISPALVSLVYLLILISVIWLAVPVFFSIHGIFIHADHLFRSISKSFRIMRYAMPSLGWFVIIALILSQGLNFLWNIAPADSWMVVFGIFGHAFVSTALLAASFFYYHDLNDWVDAALAWMKASAGSVRA
ncbi:MAG: hypothetical protein RBS68_04850 [Anaerolineales bacterium]|jgi:hypothetical protein|nr:hypothetical protein [Anaerolineales bacterium]